MDAHSNIDRQESFFRQEAIDSIKNNYGSPLKLIGISGLPTAIFFLAFLIVAAWLSLTAQYADHENVLGEVTPVDGALKITTSRAGIADHIFIKEGDYVKAGQKLMHVSSAPNLLAGNSLAEGVKQYQSEQMAAQNLETSAKLDEITMQIQEIDTHVMGIEVDLKKLHEGYELQEKRVALQEKVDIGAHTLASQGMMAIMSVNAKDEDLIASKQNLAALDREIAQQKSLQKQLSVQSKRLKAQYRTIQSEELIQKAQFHEKVITTEATYADNIVSSIDGVVATLQIREKGPVNPGQTIAIIVPQKNKDNANGLEVELWAPSRAIGFVKIGEKVRIMYDAFPYQTFGVGNGKVSDISNAPVMPNELPIPIETKEQLFRIRVTLDSNEIYAHSRSWPITPGMRLSADLISDKKTIFKWILNPISAFNKRNAA